VGDHDQSLYRFRGATIELFRDFCARCAAALGSRRPRLVYLVENYRSPPEIVDFINALVQNDPDFAAARIQPPKPAIRANRPSQRVPVLGMFRNNVDDLATDLATLLEQIFRQGGRPRDARLTEPIRAASNGTRSSSATRLTSFDAPSWVTPQERAYHGFFDKNSRGGVFAA
jgi:DNA helicase-2/ATP-dependent DNA helicase PcrA